MKNLLCIVLFIPYMALSQVPQGVNYQAVAYDANGFELANQEIRIQVSLLEGSPSADISYSEQHTVTTDHFGMFSIIIGQGETIHDFTELDWSKSNFLRVEIDTNLDGAFTLLGITAFNSVPYSFMAEKSLQDNTQGHLIDSLSQLVANLNSRLNSILAFNSSNGITTLSDLSYYGDTIYKLGEVIDSNEPSVIRGVKSDSYGNLYILYNAYYFDDNDIYGVDENIIDTHNDYALLIKYDRSGDILWDVKFNFRSTRVADFEIIDSKVIFVLRESKLIEGESYISDNGSFDNSGGAYFVKLSTDGNEIQSFTPTNINEIFSADFGNDFIAVSTSDGLNTYSLDFEPLHSVSLSTTNHSFEDNDILVCDDKIYYQRMNGSKHLISFESNLTQNWDVSFPDEPNGNYSMHVGPIYQNNIQSFGDKIVFIDTDGPIHIPFSIHFINKQTGQSEHIISSFTPYVSSDDGEVHINYISSDQTYKCLIGLSPNNSNSHHGLNTINFSDFMLSYNRLFEITYNQELEISEIREYPRNSSRIKFDFGALHHLITDVTDNNHRLKYIYYQGTDFYFNDTRYEPGIYILKEQMK